MRSPFVSHKTSLACGLDYWDKYTEFILRIGQNKTTLILFKRRYTRTEPQNNARTSLPLVQDAFITDFATTLSIVALNPGMALRIGYDVFAQYFLQGLFSTLELLTGEVQNDKGHTVVVFQIGSLSQSTAFSEPDSEGSLRYFQLQVVDIAEELKATQELQMRRQLPLFD